MARWAREAAKQEAADAADQVAMLLFLLGQRDAQRRHLAGQFFHSFALPLQALLGRFDFPVELIVSPVGVGELGANLLLALETIDLRLQIDDDIDSGQVDPKVTGEGKNCLEALTGGLVIQPRIAL